MPTSSVRCVVTGRVQGVFYRATTANRARHLGLDGSATNLPDGTVEVVASGDPDAIAELVAWLWEGPPASDVTEVRVEECLKAVPPGFTTR